MTAPTLFDEVSSPGVRPTDPDTSKAAAVALDGSKLRPRVLGAIFAQESAHGGLTDDELERIMPDAHPGSISKRRGDLTDLGLLFDTGVRRDTRHGRAAVVWATTTVGRDEARRIGPSEDPSLDQVNGRDRLGVILDRVDRLEGSCPDGDCDYQGNRTGLLRHLSAVHGFSTLKRQANRLEATEGAMP